MNIKKGAQWFAVVFIVIGILGFIPSVTRHGYLFGIFEVDAIHNVVHLFSGVVALLCSTSEKASKSYFVLFGAVYAMVAILGFGTHEKVFSIFSVNTADTVLHLLIAIVALWFGVAGPRTPRPSAPVLS